MRRWEVATSGIPIQNNATHRMQLRYTRQGAVSNYPSLHGMEKIHKRESGTNPSTHRLQESCYVYVNKETKRTTSPMATISQSIQLQNRILTWERKRKTRCPHQQSWRPTYGRRQKTNQECGNLTTKRKILWHTRRRRDQARRNRASRIPGQRRRSNTKRIQQGRRNPNNQEQLGKMS